jgi:hypothetical protein
MTSLHNQTISGQKMSKSILSPQQSLFLSYFSNPKSETFGNAYQSAIKAQYSEEYAKNITGQMPEWLSENLGDMRRLKKAEENLTEVQNIDIKNDEGKVVPELVRERTKVDMFVAERIGKNKYSTKEGDAMGKIADAITGMRIIKDGNNI